MKKTKILYGSIVMLALMACSKDGGPSNPNPDPVANRPPGTFDLIGVTNGATKVDVFPTFSWKASVDPDGDAVTYDLLLDTQTEPTTILASNLTTTSFKLTERLHLTTPYSWKVVASDGKGKSVASSINTFTTRSLNFPTAPVTAAAFPKGIMGHASAVFENKPWVIGGDVDSDYVNTVWYRDNGSNWSVSPMSMMMFTPRFEHSTAVFDNKLWVIGGIDDNVHNNDVWYSGDGATWTQATPAANFRPRLSHTSVVFDNKLWVIAGSTKGFTAGGATNEIWYSSDGANWVQATGAAAFSPRYDHTSVVFDNKLWVIGGIDDAVKNDVWYSSDGATWAPATEMAAFPPRAGHTTVVYDDKLWVIGGYGGDYKNDVWFSSDGVIWAQATGVVPFSPRYNLTTVVFEDQIWVIGGYDNQYKNDVWALD